MRCPRYVHNLQLLAGHALSDKKGVQLSSDSELSVKNGAELLDRLVKDIVAESAANYVSVLHYPEKKEPEPSRDEMAEGEGGGGDGSRSEEGEVYSEVLPTAFSLARFIPLLKERIHTISPFTRTFLVSWLTLLDTIPDLELVSYLPEFLAGLIRFLGDPSRDVNVATQNLLERFLAEIKRVAHIKKGIEDSRREQDSTGRRLSTASEMTSTAVTDLAAADANRNETALGESDSEVLQEEEEETAGEEEHVEGDWIPGQDLQIDYPRILDILLGFVDASFGENATESFTSKKTKRHT